MVDVRDILESAELDAAVRALENLIAKYGRSSGRSTHKTFKELALGRVFRTEEVLEILNASEPLYPGFKEVLAGGFIGWLILPEERAVRNNLMIQEVLWHLDSTERKVGLLAEPLTLGRDIVARYAITGFDFLSEIYNELGGYEAFKRVNNTDSVRALLLPELKVINTCVRTLVYLHHSADRYRKGDHDLPPSLNKATLILRDLKSADRNAFKKAGLVSRSQLHARWSRSKETLALLYAASTMKLGRKTLLQAILAMNLPYGSFAGILGEWLGRAQYVSQHIFSLMSDEELQLETVVLLPEVKACPFPPPDLTSIELTALVKHFQKSVKRT